MSIKSELRDLKREICCILRNRANNLQTLQVGPMMELVEDGVYSPASPFLRVRDSGKVIILDNWEADGFTYILRGRRYGRCITIWLQISPLDPGTADWSVRKEFLNGWILGRPDFNIVEIRHFEGSGTLPNIPDAGLAQWYLDPEDPNPAIVGYTLTSEDPVSAQMTFSYTTSDAWPIGIPTDATGTTIDNPPTPVPDTMTITLDDIGNPTTIGDTFNFSASTDQTPDEPLILHLQVLGGESRDFTMTSVGGGNWAYNGWVSYYTEPTWDVDQTLEYYVTGKFNGVTYSSDTFSSDGV